MNIFKTKTNFDSFFYTKKFIFKQYNFHPQEITEWKLELVEYVIRLSGHVFSYCYLKNTIVQCVHH